MPTGQYQICRTYFPTLLHGGGAPGKDAEEGDYAVKYTVYSFNLVMFGKLNWESIRGLKPLDFQDVQRTDTI